MATNKEPKSRIYGRQKKGKSTGLFTQGIQIKGTRSGKQSAVADTMIGINEQANIDLMITDRAVRYPQLSPMQYLTEIRSLTTELARELLIRAPSEQWENAHIEITNALTEKVVKRQVDLVAETIELHIKASKLTMARAMEMLSKLNVSDKAEYTMGEDAEGRKKRVKKYSLTAKVIKDCADAIKVGVEVYRKSVGLKDNDGMEDILKTLERVKIQQVNTTINTQINVTSPVDEALKKLTYDDIFELIEMKRSGSAAPSLPDAADVDKLGS